MVEIEAILPLIGVMVTGGLVPIVVKKLDLGKVSKNHVEKRLEDMEERLRQVELWKAKVENGNHNK